MFSKIKNKVLGARWIIAAIMKVFENRFYAASDDQLCPPAWRYGREDGDFINAGNMAGGAMKNLVAHIFYPFNDSTSGPKEVLEGYGRTTPQGDAVYAYMPVGSRFKILAVDGSGVVTSSSEYLKVLTGANGWYKINVSVTAPSHVIVAAGTHTVTNTTIQTITVAVATVGDNAFTRLTTASAGAPVTSANTATAGFIVTTLSAAGTAGATMQYEVIRAVTA
jgi:hypothetical protein